MSVKKIFTGELSRTVAESKITFDIEDSPSKGKPNVIYIVLDDLGFSHRNIENL